MLSGKIVTGRLVRLQVQKHYDELAKPIPNRRFNEQAAWRACAFFWFLRHAKGRFSGKPFELSDWQLFVTWCIFGWQRLNVRNEWVRRFRTVYSEIARKNGKSTWAAGVALYMLAFDGEDGAEVYSAATTRDQAAIVWDTATAMAKRSPEWSGRLKFLRHSVRNLDTFSRFEPLSADADSLDGLNIHCAVVDELHAHKDRRVWEVLDTATGARSQPMIFAITTAGSDEESICAEVRRTAVGVLDGTFKEVDDWFAWITTIDADDDPLHDESCWVKANPGLGESVEIEDLRRKVRIAREIPSKRNSILRLHFNKWTEQEELAIAMEDWNSCPSEAFDYAAMKYRFCYGGLDLSKTGDLTAFALVFPPQNDGEPWKVLPKFWLPEDTVAKKSGMDRDMHKMWASSGILELCDGEKIDYSLVRKRILELSSQFTFVDVAYDPWNAEETARCLVQDGIQMISFGQTPRNFNEPTKKILELVHAHQLAHGGHPILKWNASNLSVEEDKNNNLRPIKPKLRTSTRRIDGIVATIMAIGRAIVGQGGASNYELVVA